MSNETITIDRVLDLIAAFGAEPGAWPESEREAGRDLLRAEPEAFADALVEARALDAVLMQQALPEPSVALADMILAEAPSPRPERVGVLNAFGRMLFPQGVRWPAGAALASLLMGLVGGYAYASTGASYDEADAVYSAAFGIYDSVVWTVLE